MIDKLVKICDPIIIEALLVSEQAWTPNYTWLHYPGRTTSWWRQRRRSWWFPPNGKRWMQASTELKLIHNSESRFEVITKHAEKFQKTNLNIWPGDWKRRWNWPEKGCDRGREGGPGGQDQVFHVCTCICICLWICICIYIEAEREAHIKFSVVQVWTEYPGEGEFCHNGEDYWLNSPGQGTHQDWCWVLQGDLFSSSALSSNKLHSVSMSPLSRFKSKQRQIVFCSHRSFSSSRRLKQSPQTIRFEIDACRI